MVEPVEVDEVVVFGGDGGCGGGCEDDRGGTILTGGTMVGSGGIIGLVMVVFVVVAGVSRLGVHLVAAYDCFFDTGGSGGGFWDVVLVVPVVVTTVACCCCFFIFFFCASSSCNMVSCNCVLSALTSWVVIPGGTTSLTISVDDCDGCWVKKYTSKTIMPSANAPNPYTVSLMAETVIPASRKIA